jgi:hypothetical protein
MATIQKINLGNIVNDGLGDDLRTAFQKVNANFTELNSALTITASNLGAAGEEVFKQKLGTNLEFRKLIAGNKIQLTGTPDSIIVSSTTANGFTRISTNLGQVLADDHQLITMEGDADVSVTAVGPVIKISTVLDLHQILEVLDFGPISGTFNSIVQMNTSMSNLDFGTIYNPGRTDVDLGPFVIIAPA